ncbi:MAG: hypothetical protein JW818_04925 [Pirellulales bacterium]|nr:hypothetical protein [Pirellulales bacterium]
MQFTLRTLLVLFVAVAATLAAFGLLAVLGVGYFMVLALFYRAAKLVPVDKPFSCVAGLVILGVLCSPCALSLFLIPDPFDSDRQAAYYETQEAETTYSNLPQALWRTTSLPRPLWARIVAGVILLLSLAYLLTRPLPPVLVRWAEERTTKSSKQTTRME